MTRSMRPQDLIDSQVVDREGAKLGKVGTVYLSDDTQQPEWVTVKTGLFGHRESFVPLSGAAFDEDQLRVQVAKDQVSDAPHIDAEGHLSSQESAELYQYYGLPMQRDRMSQDRSDVAAAGGIQDRSRQAQGQAGRQQAQQQARSEGRDQDRSAPKPGPTGRTAQDRAAQDRTAEQDQRAGRANRDDDNSMTLSEERLKVGTERVETGHVRLRKYVVTEEQQVTVPVSHEEVRLEREPISDARPGEATIEEGEQDITLYAEKPVVSKETVATERVRFGKQNVTEEQQVTGQIRKEQIDIDQDGGNPSQR